MDVVQELEHYLSKNTIDIFVREMMVQCLKDKPEEPKQYLLKYILGKNAGESTEEVAVASTSSEKDGAPMHVAVSHPDTAMQQYLTDKKVAQAFLEIMRQVVEQKPDNVLSFIAVTAHNLHKSPPPSLQ
uniref:Uncharacterized protein n=1 Tax=Chlamydomonas leiostraca TaxID=1034604 RepID=A0A7S0X0P5_9CHLO|mmetsp:Transcript_38173/g.96612  ORF Transcript_38173/g.96612 Transcript_38173/m.96612 type:complete len:129 (+) Transcript_38173:73-459(+)